MRRRATTRISIKTANEIFEWTLFYCRYKSGLRSPPCGRAGARTALKNWKPLARSINHVREFVSLHETLV
jgi:hypothetical protein